MSFTDIKGHSKAIDILRRQIASKRIPSAFLFCGPRGVGKTTTAVQCAQALQCASGGDDACSVCRRIKERNYPDVEIIDYAWQETVVKQDTKTKRQTIGIETIQVLQNRAALKPMEGSYRIYIIDRADTMTIEAANSFLKILEEPPAHTLFILIAEREYAILPTIRSRCQIVRFGCLNKKDFSAVLKKSGITPQDAYIAADGSPGIALEIGIEGIEDIKNIEPLWQHSALGDTLAVLSAAQREYDTKEEIEDMIEQLLRYTRRCFRQDYAGWSGAIARIMTAQKQLKKNCNARLIRDILLIQLSREMYANRRRN